ncbi:MAG: recombination mediator RecR [Terrimicrobiaceae bacterium]|nr:recombination mediator RecR [Terrimicrobiaceae bacterium]
MAFDYPAPFLLLTRELRRLPGIGPRSAERIALWILSNKDARPAQLSEALASAATSIHPCEQCGFFATENLCEICLQPSRGGRELCIVEVATDILPLEKTGSFRGLYHALGGRLAPLDHIGPDQLRIGPLLQRLRAGKPTEIILALSADVEGEATTNYLVEILEPLAIPLTRIAHGLPAGGGLEHADQITLQRALSGRRPVAER